MLLPRSSRSLSVCALGLAFLGGCKHTCTQCCCCQPRQEISPAPVAEDSSTAQTAEAPPEEQPSGAGYSLSGSEEKVRRRSFADITANSNFAHAPDYSWVSGELQHFGNSDEWRIRYASVDEDDQYGGSMVLSGATSSADLKPGLIVRIVGHVIEADPNKGHPSYIVTGIERLPSLP
jgi:hypothetical protein